MQLSIPNSELNLSDRGSRVNGMIECKQLKVRKKRVSLHVALVVNTQLVNTNH